MLFRSQGPTAGTTWHGLFENDHWRRRYLIDIAARSGKDFIPAPENGFADRREARIDAIADLVEEHLDTDRLMALLDGGASAPLPRVSLGLG